MAARVSIAELLNAGITPGANAAVAIARSLMRGNSRAALLTVPHEAPMPDNVYLEPDGSIGGPGCEAMPSVSEVALFLRQLVPAGSAGVPGGLHYAVARALLEVDAPPFESVEDFSRALARFEHGDCAQLVCVLVATAQTNAGVRTLPSTERRRQAPATFSDLRRALQEADAQIFEQKRAMETLAAKRPPRTWNWPAAAASLLAAAAVGIAAGSALHARVAARTSEMAAHALAAPSTAAAQEAPPHDVVLEAPVHRADAVSTPHPVAKRPAASIRRVRGPEKTPLLKRLRLQWLRKAFTGRT